MENKNLFQQVRNLNLPLGKYVLFGSAPLGIRGLRKCSDIAVLVTDSVFEDYSKDKAWCFRTSPSGSDSLVLGDIELFKNWPGIENIEEFIQNAEILEDLPFVRLSDLLSWKKSRGKEKDFKDIETIETYLKSKSFGNNVV
jgi:hypothetical protein